MGFFFRLVAGLAGLAGLLKLLERRQSSQPAFAPDRPPELTVAEADPAAELRRRLAETRHGPEKRHGPPPEPPGEGSAQPVVRQSAAARVPAVPGVEPPRPGDPSTDAAAWIAERRSRIHARAQEAIEAMSELET